MKKVRFETPDKGLVFKNMEERECHSPRPFTERQVYTDTPNIYNCPKLLPYSNDPIQLFECSNSSPYPTMNKTDLPGNDKDVHVSPSNDLDLSMLDATNHVPWQPAFSKLALRPTAFENYSNIIRTEMNGENRLLGTSQNKSVKPPNVLVKDDDFFIKRDNLGKNHFGISPGPYQINNVHLDKENNPFAKKSQMSQMSGLKQPESKNIGQPASITVSSSDCRCHHCVKDVSPRMENIFREQPAHQHMGYCGHPCLSNNEIHHCRCGLPPPPSLCSCCNHIPQLNNYKCTNKAPDMEVYSKINAVDKKTLAIERYEKSTKSGSMDVEKQANISKEKREPTVSDLFKIIKLQNEQLQLLQEKVDKFISASQQKNVPVQNCVSDHMVIENIENEQHKISIGVMTSFEMVRTSTIINKEVVKTSDNAQIQCNKSQISIKEVLSKSQTPNFLDGLTPMGKSVPDNVCGGSILGNMGNVMNDEKTLNELSLYNVQVDNATTPLISPEQTLYLDVRDYSDSETGSDDQSNVGWTYYNKVMTHVNGVLQDSDMPSSASAMYRNTRQQLQTVQMQIDKTNVSVTKRVKFGDDPLHIRQPHVYTGSTDTSLKMNQLAAKYLKASPAMAVIQKPKARPTTTPIDMSFATRNYMERHKILQAAPTSHLPMSTEMPRFLDITALKQQPKLL